MRPRNTENAFWQRVAIGAPDDCWPWLGFKTDRGYGQSAWQGKPRQAHRLAYLFVNGAWPVVTLHTCDNPPCCNPAHLKSGTQTDNLHDMRRKGRQRPGQSKLTLVLVQRLRALYWDFPISYAALGRAFGVTKKTARDVVLRRTWSHI